MIQLTGTVGSSGKYLVSGIPVNTKSNAVLKIAFANNTAGTNLGLFAGTSASLPPEPAEMQLSDSGGPGFQFLTITDTQTLEGQVIFVDASSVPQIRSLRSTSNSTYAELRDLRQPLRDAAN